MLIESKLVSAKSFHPKLQYYISQKASLADSKCSLFIVQSLPKSLFVDPYQIEQLPLKIVLDVAGDYNLENPVHLIKEEIMFAVKASDDAVEIPLHTRYQEPCSAGNHYNYIEIPSPVSVWVCPSGNQ